MLSKIKDFFITGFWCDLSTLKEVVDSVPVCVSDVDRFIVAGITKGIHSVELNLVPSYINEDGEVVSFHAEFYLCEYYDGAWGSIGSVNGISPVLDSSMDKKDVKRQLELALKYTMKN